MLTNRLGSYKIMAKFPMTPEARKARGVAAANMRWRKHKKPEDEQDDFDDEDLENPKYHKKAPTPEPPAEQELPCGSCRLADGRIVTREEMIATVDRHFARERRRSWVRDS
jgi:hypothetical protein